MTQTALVPQRTHLTNIPSSLPFCSTENQGGFLTKAAERECLSRINDVFQINLASRIYQASQKYDSWCYINSGFQIIMKELPKIT